MDPVLWDFGVRDFASTKDKHQHAIAPKILKSDHHFRILDFEIL
jgi:hypothetical protein